MSQIPTSSGTPGAAKGPQLAPDPTSSMRASTWIECLAGVFPFLSFGLTVTLSEAGYRFLLTGFFDTFFNYILLLIIAAFAWYKGSPRWSYPYTGFLLLFTWYREDFEMPGWQVLGHTVFPRGEFWNWRAWIPFGVAVLLVLLAARSWKPWAALVQNIRRDWTLFAFGLYGMVPLVCWWLFDEMHGIWIVISLGVFNLFLLAGALGYMRSISTRQRVVAMLAGLLTTWPIVILVPVFYWHGRIVPYLSEPINGYSQLLPEILFAAIITLIIFSPGLINLTIHKLKALRPQKAG